MAAHKIHSFSSSTASGTTVVQDLDRESSFFWSRTSSRKLITSVAVAPEWDRINYLIAYNNQVHAEVTQMQPYRLQLKRSFHNINLGRPLTFVSPKQGQIPTGGENVGQGLGDHTGAPG